MSSAPQFCERAFSQGGLLAVALGAVVFVASPIISHAQEPLQLPSSYYQDLEAYLASPEAGKDASVPIAPEELGLSPQGEGGGEANASIAPLSLFSAQSLNTSLQSSIYDFALQFVSINGNVPTVPGCDRLPSGALRSFFDNFDDGLLEEGCTAEFQKFGTFEESDGLLHMRSENGYHAGDGIHHNPVYKTTFKDGQGNFFAGAAFRPDVPQPPPLFSSYSVHLMDAPPPPAFIPSPFLPNVSVHMLTLSDGRSIVSADRIDESGRIFRSVLFNPVGQVSVLFGFSVNDATNTVTPYYSFDLGQTVFVWRNPDGSTFTAQLFTKAEEARFVMATFARELPMMVKPTIGGKIVQLKSTRHSGIDIDSDINNTPVKAAANGTVIQKALADGSCGDWVWIFHGDISKLDGTVASKISTTYLHTTSTAVSLGDTVSAGQQIGLVDSTGLDLSKPGVGAHLHFGVRQGDIPNVRVCDQNQRTGDTTTVLNPLEFVDYELNPRHFEIKTESPVDIVLIDPDGLMISKQVNELGAAAKYSEVEYIDGVGEEGVSGYDVIQIDARKDGDYLIKVIPEPIATNIDSYTLSVNTAATTTVLVENVLVSDIPDQPYIIRTSEENIEKIIPAEVRVDPETLNLASRGVFTAFIKIEKGFGATIQDINSDTITIFGARPIQTTINEGTDTLIAKFNRQDLVGLSAGNQVKLLLMGKLIDGTAFEGSDITKITGGKAAEAELSVLLANFYEILSELLKLIQARLAF